MGSSKKVLRADGTVRSGTGAAIDLATLGPLLTEREVAERFGWSEKTLQQRRFLGKPPRFVRIGTFSIRYPEKWLSEIVSEGPEST
jgi:hypothetical protein